MKNIAQSPHTITMTNAPLSHTQRAICALGFAFVFCAWLYVFAMLAPFMDSSASYAIQLVCVLCVSVCVLCALYVWLIVPRILALWFGFFVGIGLFYWIGLSFRYSIAPFATPFVWLGIGLVYGLLCYLGLYVASRIYRIISLLLLGVITPFSFDWFVPQSWLSYSVFRIDSLSFIALMLALSLLTPYVRVLIAYHPTQSSSKCPQIAQTRLRFVLQKPSLARSILSLAIILACVDWQFLAYSSSTHKNTNHTSQAPALDSKHDVLAHIAIAQTAIAQDVKWEVSTMDSVLESITSAIDSAYTQGKKMIVFPETILPFVLNEDASFQRAVLEKLTQLGEQITIVIGSFSSHNTSVRNSTYIFSKDGAQILHKVVLAPFGEKIPLPDFLAKPLYRAFFGIEDGLGNASEPQDFSAIGRIWRNAICYEGTSELLYANNPKQLVMISNNAWFYPSIEPHLQRTLLKYYARKHGTLIVHSANLSASMAIMPDRLGDDISSVYQLESIPQADSTLSMDSVSQLESNS